MARTVNTERRIYQHRPRLGDRPADLLPGPLDDPDELQVPRRRPIADPPLFLFFDWTLENYSVVQERSDYMRYLWNSVIIAGFSTILGIIVAVPARMVDGLRAVEADQGRAPLDALDPRCCRRWGVLYPIYLLFIQLELLDTRARPGRGDDADKPADHRVDAIHLFQGGFRARSWKPRGWTARLCAKRFCTCSRPWPCRASPRPFS